MHDNNGFSLSQPEMPRDALLPPAAPVREIHMRGLVGLYTIRIARDSGCGIAIEPPAGFDPEGALEHHDLADVMRRLGPILAANLLPPPRAVRRWLLERAGGGE